MIAVGASSTPWSAPPCARHETMVPARNLLRRHCDNYGGGSCYDVNVRGGFRHDLFAVSSGLVMAEEDCRSGGEGAGGGEGRGDDDRGEVGTSSKGEEGNEEWLQLGIGASGGAGFSSPGRPKLDSTPMEPERQRRVGELLELDLFRERPLEPRLGASRPPLPVAPPAAGVATSPGAMMPLFPAHTGLLTYRPYPPDVSWGFWNPQASTSTLPGPYNSRQLVYTAPGSSGSPAEGESSTPMADIRVVSPPSRPHTGVWFVLQASQNQVREPFLPQIPKCYLRIKDGRMTVRLLMKYLVNKLGLDNESEVEITCRGQQLHPFLTLQHVRDNIWCPRDAVQLLPESPSNHVMTLQYARSA